MNIYFQISALIYLILTIVIFYTKKKIKTLENYIYKGILAVSFIEIILDILLNIVCFLYPNSLLGEILCKLFLCSFLSWALTFAYYIYAITSTKNDGAIIVGNNEKFKYFTSILLFLIIFIAMLDFSLFMMPIEITKYENYVLYDGPAVLFMYLCTISCLIFCIFTLLYNRVNIKSKKYTPIYLFCLFIIVGFIVQIYLPQVPINSIICGFMAIFLYFTIENPDLRLIEELNVAQKQAESANHAKSDFLSSMSHEIRTPLNAIIGFSQALAKEDISGSAKEEVKDILSASQSLLEIVNGILDVSKIEANKIEIVKIDYSTEKLVKESINILNSKVGSKSIEVKTVIDEELPKVLIGDVIRVKQIITNLLTNAAKYTKEGYILFSIKTSIQNNKCRLFITVEDSGIGMTEKDLELLFTKFQRFDIDDNINIEGTGLGMAITKGLVELMNGEISVKSEYGKGTTFTVIIEQEISSKSLEEISQTEETNGVEPFNAYGQSILVVDDNKINLKVAERLLREYNLTIETADSGKECLSKILNGKKYDLIFLDIMMPKMKGPEVLQNLKNISGFNTPVIALTADVISGMEDKYIKEGFDDCLPKPIIDEDLYRILKKYLKESNELPNKITSSDLQENSKYNIKYLEENGVNVTQGLELLKDIEMYNVTMSQFFDELDEKLRELKIFKDNEDMDNYNILVHSLKTESRYLGFNDLADISYEQELASKEKNIEYITNNYSVLKKEAIRIKNIIEKYLGGE